MNKFSSRKTFTLIAGGAANEISYLDTYDYYLISGGGGAALVGGNTFTLKAGETAIDGLYFRFKFEGNVVPGGGNNVVIFGQTLSANQSKKESWIEVTRSGGVWVVDITPDISVDAWLETTAISALAYAVAADITTGTDQAKIVTAKSVSDWWTSVKLLVQTWAGIQTLTLNPIVSAFTANKFLRSSSTKQIIETDLYEVIPVEVSFETDELGTNGTLIPYAFEIQACRTVVKSKDIDITDDAVVTLNINGSPVTNGAITITGGSTLNTIDTCTPTAAHTGAANDIITAVATKTTPGGRVRLELVVKRILS